MNTEPTSLLDAAEHARNAGDAAQAERLYREAVVAGESNPAVLYNIGTYCASRQAWPEAIEHFQEATRQAPEFALAWYNLGCCLREQGRMHDAGEALRHALTLDPGLHAARVNLSLVEFALGRTEEAIRLAYTALEAQPGDPDVFANLSTYLRTAGLNADARLCAETALRLDSSHTGAWQALGTLAQDQRAFGIAIQCYQHALASQPDNAAAHWNLGLAALASGDFALGWQEYEWRTRLPHMRMHYPDHGLPRWQGEPLAGKTLLLVAEQGHGDTLQFIRLARQVKALGACVKLMAQPALIRLLQPLPWLDDVCSQTDPAPSADFILPLLSLPQQLKLQLDDLPGAFPYLQASADSIAHWQQRLAGETRPRIGLVWSGDPRPHDPESHRIDARRSLPLTELAPVFTQAPHCAWYSLQKGSAATQAGAWPQLVDHSEAWQDFADTAGFVMQMDLVITVDTAMAHLSAGLGRPTWVLSRFDACWRWLDGRNDSPWYPGLRLFRQRQPGAWDAPISEVLTALRDCFKGTAFA